MNRPPDEVPDGLSGPEYQRLIALYTLMGRHEQAHHALAKFSEVSKAETKNSDTCDSENQESNDSYEAGQVAGANFAHALMELLQELSKKANGETEETETSTEAEDENENDANKTAEIAASAQQEDSHTSEVSSALQAMKNQLLAVGLTESEAGDYLQKLQDTLKEATSHKPPPRDLPEDLTAKEYWELALKYKQVGWTEQARDALTFAIELDGDGEYGKKAMCFLRSKIPRHPVPLLAEQLNIQGYNQMFENEAAAKETFETLVDQYPDFEWPYGNLGSLLIKEGKLEQAEALLTKAVVINPYYINGWLHLSRVYAIESRFKEADNCLERVMAIDPGDPNWKGIRELVDQLKNGSE